MGGAQTAEVPALHAAGEALTDRGAGDVDELADDEVVGKDLGADRDHGIRGDAELLDPALRLDLGDRELAALSLGHVNGLAGARTKLECDVTVLLFSAVAYDWQLPSFSTVTGICSPASVKTRVIPTFCAITPERIGVLPVLSVRYSRERDPKILELDLDVDTGGRVELHQSIDGLRVGSTMSSRRL